MTMNNHWGYAAFDHDFKPAPVIVRKLVECVSKGGNMLMNVGPDARGRIPEESVKILTEVGHWMAKNGESVHGCGAGPWEKPEFGRITWDGGKTLYLHVTEPVIGSAYLKDVKPEQIKAARLLSSGAELVLQSSCTNRNYPDYAFIPLGPEGSGTYPLPDGIDTVVKVVLK